MPSSSCVGWQGAKPAKKAKEIINWAKKPYLLLSL